MARYRDAPFRVVQTPAAAVTLYDWEQRRTLLALGGDSICDAGGCRVVFGSLGLGAGAGVALMTSPFAARISAVLAGGIGGSAGGYLISLGTAYPDSAVTLASLAAGACALAGLGIGLVVAALSDRV